VGDRLKRGVLPIDSVAASDRGRRRPDRPSDDPASACLRCRRPIAGVSPWRSPSARPPWRPPWRTLWAAPIWTPQLTQLAANPDVDGCARPLSG